MTYLNVAAWLMVVFGGVWAGGILIFAVERTNLWRRMSIEQFAVDFRRSVLRVDPMMPILGAIAGIAGVVFALGTSGPSCALAWAGVACIALVIVGSITIAEPMNSKFRRLPEGQMPDGIESIRIKWRRFHAVRNLVSLATIAFLAGAAVLH